MGDERFNLIEIHTDGEGKVHWIDGVPYNCSGSADCQQCTMDKRKVLRDWLQSIPYPKKKFFHWLNEGIPRWAIGETVEMICRKCHKENIPCYECIKFECEEWFKEEGRVGQVEGCAYFFEGFCMDWWCARSEELIKKPD